MCFTIRYTIYILCSTCNKFNCPVTDRFHLISLLLYNGCCESLCYIKIIMIMIIMMMIIIIIIIELLKLLQIIYYLLLVQFHFKLPLCQTRKCLIYLNDTCENTTEVCLGNLVKIYKDCDINL